MEESEGAGRTRVVGDECAKVWDKYGSGNHYYFC
jgi:hypothetical protein